MIQLSIITNVVKIISQYKEMANPQIPLPKNIYLPQRENSQGYDMDNELTRTKMIKLFDSKDLNLNAFSLIKGKNSNDELKPVYNPSNLNYKLGNVAFASDSSIKNSLNTASDFFPYWKNIELI